MKKKVICCVGLVLSMICLIGCAAKGTQDTPTPAPAAISPQAEAPAASEPDPVPEPTVQETTPVVVEQAKAADTPVNADTEVPQAAPVPTTQPNVTEDIPSETVHAKTGYVEPEPAPSEPEEPKPEPEPESKPDPEPEGPAEPVEVPVREDARALTLADGDELIAVMKTNGEQNILLATADGMAICFSESDVRVMGRDAAGVRGIALSEGDYVVGAGIAEEGKQLLTVTELGYGKRTEITEYMRLGEDGRRHVQQRGEEVRTAGRLMRLHQRGIGLMHAQLPQWVFHQKCRQRGRRGISGCLMYCIFNTHFFSSALALLLYVYCAFIARICSGVNAPLKTRWGRRIALSARR